MGGLPPRPPNAGAIYLAFREIAAFPSDEGVLITATILIVSILVRPIAPIDCLFSLFYSI